MTTLFLRPGACSLASHIVLIETGTPFETVEVDLTSKKTKNGDDYLAVNPKGQVPALLLESGELLTEGSAILQYLADAYPRTGLLPSIGTLDRYRVIEWLSFLSSEVHKTISPLMRPDTPAEYRPVAIGLVKKRFEVIDAHLDGRNTLTDAGFTIADAYLFVLASWLPRLGIDPADYPSLAVFSGAHSQRPSITAALLAEGLA